MISMDSTKISFDGQDLTKFGMCQVFIGDKGKNIFAGEKSLVTSNAMYRQQNVITGISYIPLSFEITLCPLGNPWTEQIVTELHKLLDVVTYKVLRFGNDNIYYNAIPFVGGISEMVLYYQSKGYVTIPFICDAPHGWIDKEYHFPRHGSDGSSTVVWEIENPCNVRDYSGYCRVYPYIEIDNFEASHDNFVSFCLAVDDPTKADWFTMSNINLTGEQADKALIIDCYNKQVYDKNDPNNSLISCMGDDIKFFYLNEGSNTIWHRTFVGGTILREQSYYDAHFYLTIPYMK